MERKIRPGVGRVLMVLVIVLVLQNDMVSSERIYRCWGGCFNTCFQGTGKAGPESLSCSSQCLNRCLPRSPADYQYYCGIGCAVLKCVPVSLDGARMESCFGKCTNLCGKTSQP